MNSPGKAEGVQGCTPPDDEGVHPASLSYPKLASFEEYSAIFGCESSLPIGYAGRLAWGAV